MPSSLPSRRTTSAPTLFSAISSMASYTVESGEMDQTPGAFRRSTDITGSSSWTLGSMEALTVCIASPLTRYSGPAGRRRQGSVTDGCGHHGGRAPFRRHLLCRGHAHRYPKTDHQRDGRGIGIRQKRDRHQESHHGQQVTETSVGDVGVTPLARGPVRPGNRPNGGSDTQQEENQRRYPAFARHLGPGAVSRVPERPLDLVLLRLIVGKLIGSYAEQRVLDRISHALPEQMAARFRGFIGFLVLLTK